MAAVDFPNSPSVNDEFTSGTRTWIWDGNVWLLKGVAISLDVLSDVTLTTPASGETLIYDGSDWVNSELGGSLEVSDTAPASPSVGDLWFDSTSGNTYVYFDSFWVEAIGSDGIVSGGSLYTNSDVDTHLNTSTAANGEVLSWTGSDYDWVAQSSGSSSGLEWTRFYFDRGGVTPTGNIANSSEVGANFGTWTETTAANSGTTYATPTNSTYDPTLTGVTVSNGIFSLPAGIYDISASIYMKIYNTGGTTYKQDFYLYGQSGSAWAGSYDQMLIIPDTTNWINNDFVVNVGGLFVFENATASNNTFYVQMGTAGNIVNPNLFPDYGFVNIRKVG